MNSARNGDLFQHRRRAGGDGSHATRWDRPPIRETVFGRDAVYERGGDHVTRAFHAMDRGDGHHERRSERESGERRGGKSRERSAGCERAGKESGRPERELDRGPVDAGGSGRESGHGKAAGPKPNPPDGDLGV